MKELDFMRLKAKKITEKLKGRGATICKCLTSKVNKKRDTILIGIYFFTLVFFVFTAKSSLFKDKQSEKITDEMDAILSEEQIYQEVKAVQETLDFTNWKAYQSRWYGVELRYPESWLAPKIQSFSKGSNWEYRYQFRKNIAEENNPYIGFDLVIYNLTKIKELTDTAEFPTVKDETLKAEGKCDTIVGHIIETGDYPAEEIYIPPTDDCYNSALFFSFIKDQYIYNFVPMTKEGMVLAGDPRVEIIDNFPEFFGAVSTLKIIDIVRPKPIASKPRISAPRPVAATKGSGYGNLVCANKNDRPAKSSKDKGKHMDMECCLDPDEYPNPWCSYSQEKYGKYLK